MTSPAKLLFVAVAALAAAAGAAGSAATPAGMVFVPAGEYAPLLRTAAEPERVVVSGFWMDERPVTNAEFLAFVTAHPQWRRSCVSPLFADDNYLAHWAADLELGPAAPPDSPVVRMSWFAARAYADAQGKRLPTTAEWERSAAVGFTTEDAATEPAVQRLINTWFSRPTPEVLPPAGGGRANLLGLRDLHGLVWEWVDDFNAALVTGESRGSAGLERDLYCGAGAVGARDRTNYAAYMRAGYRASLKAAYSVPNLGFRCVLSP
ncbi:MAG TPA: formylglycine-generating enzyme family protein [Opitutaceae bacterium]